MRNIAFVFSIFLSLMVQDAFGTIEWKGNAQSRGGPFGLGAMIGDPLAISAKYFLDQTSAIDLGVGPSL